MKVLIVCSGNYENFDFQKNQAFIFDQIKSIERTNSAFFFETFFIKGKGLTGYLKNIPALGKTINSVKPDIIHAHGGVAGLLCCTQWKVPVICTFHGSDVNIPFLNVVSSLVGLLAKNLIFVSQKLKDKSYLKFPRKTFSIPCGVDLELFYPNKVKNDLSTGNSRKILFASAFNIPVKNYSLAIEALNLLNQNTDLVELKDKTRTEVCALLNSVELLLLTSFSEGSPQVIKEAMACNCPIVSTGAGDVSMVIGETEGCYICGYNPKDVAEKIQLALQFATNQGRTNGRQRIIELGLNSESIAARIIEVYKKTLRE